MLSLVSLVDQWQAIERGLSEGWGNARLRLTVAEDGDPERAAALLGPATPGRHGRVISFFVARRGAGPSPELVRRLLRRLDQEGVPGDLELVGTDEPATAERVAERRTFAQTWDAEIAALPEDWSDLYAEVELASSDYLERAALLLAPLNPAQWKADARAEPARPGSGAASGALGGKPGFRFRVARRFGYGASAEMARRCFERLDEEGIRGDVRVLHALSDTRPVQTQGPVWYLGGRSV
jgi:hypothetical protein